MILSEKAWNSLQKRMKKGPTNKSIRVVKRAIKNVNKIRKATDTLFILCDSIMCFPEHDFYTPTVDVNVCITLKKKIRVNWD